jgi:hypothetical protein
MVRILVCDDEEVRANGIRQRLRRRVVDMPGYEVIVVSPEDFIQAVAGLERRQLRAREVSQMTWSPESEGDDLTGHMFDNIDILFVDYDLLQLSSVSRPSTGGESGERVCYLARCYSGCGSIVAYNQFSYRATFDMTLRGHIRSYADLNISADLASSPGLWNDEYTGFRPWSWPILAVAHERLNRRAAAILNHLADPILTTLGLDNHGTYDLFTREQLEFLSRRIDPRHATFENFVRDSSIGLRPRDWPFGSRSVARIAAARIGKWLERAVLPDQNILVDAPHLISRFPSLVGEPHTQERWNVTCSLTAPLDDLGIDIEKIQAYEFVARDWLSRPVWLWQRLAADDSIVEVSDPWSPRAESLVFCEDVSRFRPRSSATEFDADVSPEFGLRYIQRLRSVDYEPTVRFLVQDRLNAWGPESQRGYQEYGGK